MYIVEDNRKRRIPFLLVQCKHHGLNPSWRICFQECMFSITVHFNLQLNNKKKHLYKLLKNINDTIVNALQYYLHHLDLFDKFELFQSWYPNNQPGLVLSSIWHIKLAQSHVTHNLLQTVTWIFNLNKIQAVSSPCQWADLLEKNLEHSYFSR